MSQVFSSFLRTMCTAAAKSTKPPLSVFGVEGRYVSALYSAALQKNQLEAVEKTFKEMQNVLTRPKVLDFIESSQMSNTAKAKLFEDFGKQANLASTTTNFLMVVAENGRLKSLKKMITMFLAVMVSHRKEALCEVITATPLDDGARSSLMSALKKFAKGKNITLTEKVDPSIIGGMIVGVEDKHIDMSIARKVQMYTDILKQAI